jgi:hypothetical protein
MKELSIEEKAKRYDEVIERAKDYYDEGKTLEYATDIVSYIFPELKESEDKRIRKDIVTYLKSILSNKKYGDKFIEDWIAWLEKQGEKAKYHDICDKCVRQPTCQSDCFLQQGEQKPWSEEEKGNIDIIISRLEVDIEYWESRSKRRVDEDKRVINWLKSLKDRYTWKPSDAQMASITCAVRKMKESACYDSELVHLLQDLKKLRGE